MAADPAVRRLGVCSYTETVARMHAFTDARTSSSRDELWLLQHESVYTLGQAADPAHVLRAGDIPVVQSDRGGQVTYHGPGQVVMYCLLDLRRLGLGVRSLVTLLEQAVVELLDSYGLVAASRRDAPGVYLQGQKIAALGLRVRRGCSFHGVALNVDLDLEPFDRINPCGYAGQPVTRLSDWCAVAGSEVVADQLATTFSLALERAAPG